MECSELGVFVNQEGWRFVKEDEVRDVVAGRILDQTISDTLADDPIAMEEVNRWLNQGVLIKWDTLEACTGYFGINKRIIRGTLDQYNQYILLGEELEFARDIDFAPLEDGPF